MSETDPVLLPASGAPQVSAPDAKNLPVLLHWLWSPFGLFIALGLPAAVGSLLIDDSSFSAMWGQAYFLTADLRISYCVTIVALMATFVLALPLATGRSYIRFDRARELWLNRATRVLFAVVLVAYLIWLFIAISRGLSPATIVSALRGEVGTMSVLKNVLFAPVSGLTTWMNLAPIILPLVLMRRKISGSPASLILVPLTLLVAGRAYFASERLALVELVVSGAISWLIIRDSPPRFIATTFRSILAVVFAWVALLLFFAVFEYNRSWANFYANQPGESLFSFAWTRLVGYYATALNNGALYISARDPDMNLFTLLPGGEFIPFASEDARVAGYQNQLWSASNPEFNNVSGFAVIIGSFGPFGGAVMTVVLAAVVVAIALYVLKGSLPALILYSVVSIGVLEISRIYYFGGSRFLVLVLGVLFIWLTFPRAEASVQAELAPAMDVARVRQRRGGVRRG